MKKINLKSMLALLLTLCMLLSGMAVLAEGITVTDGPAAGEVTVTVPDVNGKTNEGVEVTANNDEGKPDNYFEVNDDYNQVNQTDRAKIEGASALTINAGTVTEALAQPVEYKWTETDEDGNVTEYTDKYNYVYGVDAYASDDATATSLVVNSGAVNVSSTADYDGDSSTYGVAVRSENATTALGANVNGDVTAKTDVTKDEAFAYAVSADSWAGGTIGVNVTGDVSAEAASKEHMAMSQGVEVSSENKSTVAVNVTGNVAATATSENSESTAMAVNVNAYSQGTANVAVKGNIDAVNNSTYVPKDPNEYLGSSHAVYAYASEAGKVNLSVEGDITAKSAGATNTTGASFSGQGGDVTGVINGNIVAQGNGWLYGLGVEADNESEWVSEDGFDYFKPTAQKGSSTVTMNGNVTVTQSTDKDSCLGVSMNASNDSAATLTMTGNVSATNDKGQATGFNVYTSGGVAAATLTGNVTASGQNYVTGVDLWANDNTFWTENEQTKEEKTYGGDKKGSASLTLVGDVVATITGAPANVYYGGNVQALTVGAAGGSTAVLTQKGNVTANNTATDAKTRANAISISGNKDSILNVTVIGDAKATGNNSYGMNVWSDKTAKANVLVDGTVSGDTAAIHAYAKNTVTGKDGKTDVSEEDYTATNIYVWAAEKNASGNVALVEDATGVFTTYADGHTDEYGNTGYYENTYVKNEEATAKLEAAIWYIIKVNEQWQDKVTATGTGTYTADGVTYNVAHENDAVTLRFDVPSNKKLSGIMYNDGTEAEYVKNEDGSYTIQMLKGGAMMLSLKLKKKEAEKPVATEEKTEEKTEQTADETAEETTDEKTEAKAEAPVDSKDENIEYKQVKETETVNGVKAADKPEIAKALETIGASLDTEGENVTVSIPGAEKLMDEEELKTFNKLPVKDRLLVVLSALGFANDSLGDASANMSDDAKALSGTISERMNALSEDEKQALLKTIADEFPKGSVEVDGKTYESFAIDLVIDRDGEKTYERYTFYDEDGTWKLFGIEQGAYQPAEA